MVSDKCYQNYWLLNGENQNQKNPKKLVQNCFAFYVFETLHFYQGQAVVSFQWISNNIIVQDCVDLW